MDNRPEDDGPMFVPARRSYEIVQLPASRRRPSFLVLFFVIFSALLAFWLVTHWIRAYDMRLSIGQLDKSLAVAPVAPVHPVVYVPPAPVLVGPYHLPLSATYRLQGKVRSVKHDDYMATAGPGSYVMIPAKDYLMVNGGPYCKYHGATVTRRSSGVQ